jgi:hypothetical protein
MTDPTDTTETPADDEIEVDELNAVVGGQINHTHPTIL